MDQFNVGDTVVAIEDCGSYFSTGERFLVKNVESGKIWIETHGLLCDFYQFRFRLVEKKKKEKEHYYVIPDTWDHLLTLEEARKKAEEKEGAYIVVKEVGRAKNVLSREWSLT